MKWLTDWISRTFLLYRVGSSGLGKRPGSRTVCYWSPKFREKPGSDPSWLVIAHARVQDRAQSAGQATEAQETVLGLSVEWVPSSPVPAPLAGTHCSRTAEYSIPWLWCPDQVPQVPNLLPHTIITGRECHLLLHYISLVHGNMYLCFW